MDLEIIRADPAGNITIFVLSPVTDREERLRAAGALLADPGLQAEQVGFVLPPDAEGCSRLSRRLSPRCRQERRLWRLEMMGGEFCGNAARSFGLYVAEQTGLADRGGVLIAINGAPLAVRVDTAAGTAELEMSGLLAETTVECKGQDFPMYVFDGISHVIVENREPDEGLLRSLRESLDARPPIDALGVMFYDTERRFMRPLVWVRATGTTVFESSCGSGSAALGVWMARNIRNGEEHSALAQPGGTIETRVVKQEGLVRRISIGGPVGLSGPFHWSSRD
ncbi:MAG: hypothetical protein LBK62_01940 [Treponema sp.]|jgi:diaminopimelate epimerase|nr:hypothetical protein [Treponema sp.]